MTQGSRPRSFCVYFGAAEPFDGLTIRNGQAVARLASGGSASATVVAQTEYMRTSGKTKVVNRADSVTDPSMVGLLAGFDSVVAIDTNSKAIGGDFISVAAIMCCRIDVESPDRAVALCTDSGIFAFKNCRVVHPEKFSWAQFISRYQRDGRREYVVVITDHDMGSHREYNAKSKPVFGDVFLPERMRFLYASSDVSGNITNQLIRTCDTEASRVLRELGKSGRATVGTKELTLEQIPEAPSGTGDGDQ